MVELDIRKHVVNARAARSRYRPVQTRVKTSARPGAQGQSTRQSRKKRYLIFTDGETVRHFSLSPATIVGSLGVLGCVTFGFVISTSYILFNDDLALSLSSRQARMQHIYEDRITDLRAEIDRLTLLRVSQGRRPVNETGATTQTEDRTHLLDPALKRLATPQTQQTDDPSLSKPQLLRETQNRSLTAKNTLIAGSLGLAPEKNSLTPLPSVVARLNHQPEEQSKTVQAHVTPIPKPTVPKPSTTAQVKPRQVPQKKPSPQALSKQQQQRLARLENSTQRKITTLQNIAKKVGLQMPGTEDIGGPLQPLDPLHQVSPDKRLMRVKSMVAYLKKLRARMDRIPLREPLVGKVRIASRFGPRVDPFVRRAAMHSGVDFRARHGREVIATAIGKVVFAGRKGGYGKMIEVDHGSGLRTRYAHLSKIIVRVGWKVKGGHIIGKVGSTGRSTGPHLHYETLINGKAVDPLKYIKAGYQLSKL